MNFFSTSLGLYLVTLMILSGLDFVTHTFLSSSALLIALLQSTLHWFLSEKPPPPNCCAGRPLRWIRRLGSGWQGRVDLYEDNQTHERIAVKTVRLWFSNAKLQRECDILSAMNELSVYFIEYDWKERVGRLGMEFVDGFTLHDAEKNFWTQSMAEKFVVYLNQMIQKCKHLHVAHRDLDLKNLMYDNQKKRFCTIDFGCASAHKANPNEWKALARTIPAIQPLILGIFS